MRPRNSGAPKALVAGDDKAPGETWPLTWGFRWGAACRNRTDDLFITSPFGDARDGRL
jgi:hypothetical protein